MRVLAIVAHPDDETLGAGGTLTRLTRAGIEAHVLVLADGVALRHGTSTLDEAHDQCRKACATLGVHFVTFGGFGANGLLADEKSKAVVACVEAALEQVQPTLVLTHHAQDVHADHRRVHESVVYATRLPAFGSVEELLFFEVPSSTDQQASGSPFVPDTFVDIESSIQDKCAALTVYDTETHKLPHPRSPHGIRSTAQFRGLQAGLMFAEAFATGRRVLGHRTSQGWAGLS